MGQRILENVVWKEGKYYVNLYLEDDQGDGIQNVENPEIVHLSVKYG